MIKYILFVLGWLLISYPKAQHLDLDDYDKKLLSLTFDNKTENTKIWNEAPPVVLKHGAGYRFFSTTFFTTTWQHSQNLATSFNDRLVIKDNRRSTVSYATASSHWWQKFYKPEDLNSEAYKYKQQWETHYWRRNYNGVFSAHLLPANPASDKALIFAFSHGENKNEKISNYLYQNTVRPNFKIDGANESSYSGGNPYKDCWEAYFAFLNGNWMYEDTASEYFHDIGPVAWPSAGYVSEAGEQLSMGLRHPSSVLHNKQLYIFVVDTSMDGTGGVKLIRVGADEARLPEKYETWTGKEWVKALPEGFSASGTKNYFAVRGPANIAILSGKDNVIRFSVAKIKGAESKFLGVEEFIISDNSIHVAFRFSSDLINWSGRTVVYSAPSWGRSELRYPVLMNMNGVTDGEIDLNEFFVIGTTGNGKISKLYFKKSLSLTKNQNPALEEEPEISGNSPNHQSNLSQNQGASINLTAAILNLAPIPVDRTLDVYLNIKSGVHLSVNLYNVSGEMINTLIEESFMPQKTSRAIDVSELRPGIYFLTVSDGIELAKRRIIKL